MGWGFLEEDSHCLGERSSCHPIQDHPHPIYAFKHHMVMYVKTPPFTITSLASCPARGATGRAFWPRGEGSSVFYDGAGHKPRTGSSKQKMICLSPMVVLPPLFSDTPGPAQPGPAQPRPARPGPAGSAKLQPPSSQLLYVQAPRHRPRRPVTQGSVE